MDLKKRIAVLLSIHERPVSSFLKSIQGNIFVDLGANYGYYSLLLHKNFKRTYAFEPIQTLFDELELNLSRFEDVVCINKAVSNTDGQKWKSDYHGIEGETDTITLASFFRNDKIDLIKMDVEGEEWKVLEGAKPIIDNIDSWLIELHDPNRKEEIEPNFQGKKTPPNVLDIYKLTPKTNCRECGLTCMAFATALRDDPSKLSLCPYLPEEEYNKLIAR